MSSAEAVPASGPPGLSPRCINVQEAKRHLSSLLLPLDPSPRRQLRFLQGRLDEAFFEPLPGEELERWEA
jgi:hypothetical protein